MQDVVGEITYRQDGDGQSRARVFWNVTGYDLDQFRNTNKKK
jgi:hypothetical protein